MCKCIYALLVCVCTNVCWYLGWPSLACWSSLRAANTMGNCNKDAIDPTELKKHQLPRCSWSILANKHEHTTTLLANKPGNWCSFVYELLMGFMGFLMCMFSIHETRSVKSTCRFSILNQVWGNHFLGRDKLIMLTSIRDKYAYWMYLTLLHWQAKENDLILVKGDANYHLSLVDHFARIVVLI